MSSGDKPSAYITGTPENPVLNLMLQPGPQGPAVALDTTLTHEGEAADAKATGDAISAVKARQNILVGTETGNPLSVDDAFTAPLCGLTVYGKSTQSGTPTPDAPVPIVSAGDGGSVAVKVTGKNRMPSNLRYREFVECFVKKNTFITLVFKDGFVSKGGNILFIGENNENLWFGIDANKAEHHITLKANATKFQYALKEQDKFDEAAQRIAYNRALAAAKKALTQETITFIKETFGDLDSYLKPMIEAQVRSQKTYM